jgi:hypothetical protein
MIDVSFANHGTIWLAHLWTEAAHDWVATYLPEDCTWWGEAVVIEHRFVGDIAQGMADAGLAIAEHQP